MSGDPAITFIGCIGFTDSTFTVPCPEPVTCEIRTSRDGVWASWKKACDSHADGAVEVLSSSGPRWAVERRAICPGCEAELRDGMRGLGTDVMVSTSEPVVAGPYTTDGFICPHGVTYWIEPTGEQIAEWVRDGAR